MAEKNNYEITVPGFELLNSSLKKFNNSKPDTDSIKQWLAKVGYERMQEMSDPEKSVNRTLEIWQKHEY